MKEVLLSASLQSVRRLAVTKQHLAGKLPTRTTSEAALSVIRDLPYVQWDPVSVVAPSHLLSLWARVGGFRPPDLERLMWKEKKVFLHWTPVASLVLSEDYPLYVSLMERYPESLTTSWGSQRAHAQRFLSEHRELRGKILRELGGGPLQVRQFGDHTRTKRKKGEWTFASDVALMLFHLLMSGEVMLVGHEGNQNLWGLSSSFLPRGINRRALSPEEFERAAAQRAIQGLGTATPREFTYYFVRGRYQTLRATLSRLMEEGIIHRVQVEELGSREERYVHDNDVSLLDAMEGSKWQPRTSLLPPFDNMVGSSARTTKLFGFEYVREQFLPKAKRKFGTYVLPILQGERFVGRIDARVDKLAQALVINAVHAEAEFGQDRDVAFELHDAIARLASSVGATRVTYSSPVPMAWKRGLR
jgi:uncharacterized protein YcaQ